MSFKPLLRGFYQVQKLRIQTGNRICQAFYQHLGVKPGESPEEVEMLPEQKNLLEITKTFYRLMANGIYENHDALDKIIHGKYACMEQPIFKGLINMYGNLLAIEKEKEKEIAQIVKAAPVMAWLKNVRGVGPLMAAVLISEIDIAKVKYPSSLWAYAGLDVAPDGRGRGRYSEHLVEKRYPGANGKITTTQGITFNPFLKTKLLGVLGPSFLKVKSEYADYYYQYKHRLDNHPNHKNKTKGHKNRMAMRYMIKMFLIDLYKNWREIEGYEVHPPYHEEKLSIYHGKEDMGKGHDDDQLLREINRTIKLRSMERRDCRHYEKCLTEAAIKDLSHIPCAICKEAICH